MRRCPVRPVRVVRGVGKRGLQNAGCGIGRSNVQSVSSKGKNIARAQFQWAHGCESRARRYAKRLIAVWGEKRARNLAVLERFSEKVFGGIW